MHTQELASVIADRDLYRRGDGEHPQPNQVRARARRYPALFQTTNDASGRIILRHGSTTGMTDLVIFCADVGSVSNGKFGWARSDLPSASDQTHDTSKPSALVDAVCADLGAGRPVALGFECPLFVPVPTEQEALGRARAGEGSRSWSATAGTNAMATGLVQAAWVLDAIRVRHPREPLTPDWAAFVAVGQGLFIWEAFVTSTAKGASHVDDAAIAVAAFTEALPDPRSASSISAERPLSLVGAAAIWSGWSGGDDLLHVAPLVIRAT